MLKDKYDVVVVGSGPNGLAAAITMKMAGLDVLLLEGSDTIGGGLRSGELMLPGYTYDICSAIHPMAIQSPFFKSLPLKEHGLTYVKPPVLAAHPLDNGGAVGLYGSLLETARQFGKDAKTYEHLFDPLVKLWPEIVEDVLAPLHIPSSPLKMLKFGMKALKSAASTARSFKSEEMKALWAGMAAHSMLPLTHATTSAIALALSIAGHEGGWPIPIGGSQSIANALNSYFKSLGGEVLVNYYVDSMEKLPRYKAIIFDIGPKQLLKIAGQKFSSNYKKQLKSYRYGMGVFKMDWILDGPIPFASEICKKAGTVHIGNTFNEIAAGEEAVWKGKHPEKPFVLLAQQSLFDTSRTPDNRQVVWGYCHVPNGSTIDMSNAIEQQIERFAPGFRDRILMKQTINATDYERYNPNYVGGDINGGAMDIRQLFTRPALKWSPYSTSAKGIYICSSSTPPGGGVHGMCGYHAAQKALQEIFKGSVPSFQE
ncbi:phytoene desaturase family protein [Olivibacter domesticus]|uniref:Phytoene dehydrogenase-related protein n=1 Tax=Olivibacter domesticus TaxID=407022 RepID=A0A1H7XS45_OLID1|nr:NAD(P)/FAD-dependent oxidoreductase [Olivibacter domesticus]SEM36610.1 Phytoene dehydrogenase-related protein [Olivibacter domesticus]